MRVWKNRGDSLRLGLFLFLISGVVAGSLFCNGMSDAMKVELRAAEVGQLVPTAVAGLDLGRFFVRVLWKRLGQLGALLLISMTPIATVLKLFLVAGAGFSLAVTVCTITMEQGLWGMVYYLVLLFPQGLCYLAVGYVVLWWMVVEDKRLTVWSGALLTAFTVIGVLAESFLNPHLAAWLL